MRESNMTESEASLASAIAAVPIYVSNAFSESRNSLPAGQPSCETAIAACPVLSAAQPCDPRRRQPPPELPPILPSICVQRTTF